MNANPMNFLALLNTQIQYRVPRWQRRYCWAESDIRRLVEDLLTVAKAGPHASHYGGTLLTVPEPGAAGVIPKYQVIDGQQRLTTISILLACIANKLGPTGESGGWTAAIIRDHRLTNPGQKPDLHRKLRLQDGDEEIYRDGLEGNDLKNDPGAVAQAWKVIRRLVDKNAVDQLLIGLERFRVVSIGIDNEDPQQIFETLNATGRPLTESEKVKNWLLMGLSEDKQQQLYKNYWKTMENSLGVSNSTEPIDLFLRDFLRWKKKSGTIQGIRHSYDILRRWAIENKTYRNNRPALFAELARLSKLYGILTGTAGTHNHRGIEQELKHLRAMGIHNHRPLTLRLLDDLDSQKPGATEEAIARVFAAIGTWITRLWLSRHTLSGMNSAMAELAHKPGPGDSDNYIEYWLNAIRKLQYQRIGVPGDDAVREGIRTRKAYGGAATKIAFAILCALMEKEDKEEASPRKNLTIEHIMPRTLTALWRQALGPDAEEIHGTHKNCLPNLTLSGFRTNPKMGTAPFDVKKQEYAKSPLSMNRRIAQEDQWDESALKRRAKDLAHWVLKCWPWLGQENPPKTYRWRIGDEDWRYEDKASQMVLNVAATLMALDPQNVQRLSGDAIVSNVHPASLYPPNCKAGAQMMRSIPGYDDYVMYPYRNLVTCKKLCEKLSARCNVQIEIELSEPPQSPTEKFWKDLERETGGLSELRDNSGKKVSLTSNPLNMAGDTIKIYIRDQVCKLHILAGNKEDSPTRVQRLRQMSQAMVDQMSDQTIEKDPEEESLAGRTVVVKRSWDINNEGEWSDTAWWIKDQYQRLQAIVHSD